MIIVGLICITLLALTTLLHYEALRIMNASLPGLRVPPRTKLIVVMFSAFLAHGAEILLYGFAVYLLIHFADVGMLRGPGGSTLVNCMYLSAETYSSLGFGDVVPLGSIRLVAGVEALNGLLLIGWTASYAYIAMERFWNGGGKA
jgi:hypothetical protein